MSIDTTFYQDLKVEDRFRMQKALGITPDQMSYAARELVAWLMGTGGVEITEGVEALANDIRRHYRPSAGEPTCSCGADPCPYRYKARRNPSVGWRGPDGEIHRI